MIEQYKFQKLAVYQSALEYIDRTYELTKQLPDSERYNLRSQLERASTSIALNIAEGSTGQSDAEQNRFLGLAVRSYLETVACLDLIERRGYVHAEATNRLRENGHDVTTFAAVLLSKSPGESVSRQKNQNGLESSLVDFCWR